MSEPSRGVTMEDIIKLRTLLERHARLRGDFVLSSGLKSKYYFDIKPVTLDPDARAVVGRVLESIIREMGAEAAGGLEIGAVPISTAMDLPSFIVRDQKKGHGTKERIAASYSIRGAQGGLRPGCRVAVVDDVVTTGDSIQRAIDAVVEGGAELVAVVALVTRPERDAAANLSKNYNYISLFECDEEGDLRLTPRADEFVTGSTNRISHRWDCLHLAETVARAAHSRPSAAG